jgi:hypothetical protein
MLDIVNLESYEFNPTHTPRESQSICTGVSSKVLGTVNGRKVMIKGDESDESFVEYFAYKLGEKLGYNINKVELTSHGKLLGLRSNLASIHHWEEDFIVAKDLEGEIDHFSEYPMRFFDLIIDNDDCHTGNWGFINEELFLIDHGMATPWNPYIKKYWNKLFNIIDRKECDFHVDKFMSLTIEDFEKMLEIPENLEYDDGGYLFDYYREDIINRMDEIQSLIKKHRGAVAV